MSKITKNISYGILWLHHNGMEVKDIAKDLKITENQVIQFLEKNNVTKHSELPVKQSPVKSLKSKDLMIRHTRDKKINNVSIMTREASAKNDELKKQVSAKQKKLNYIFNPNESK